MRSAPLRLRFVSSPSSSPLSFIYRMQYGHENDTEGEAVFFFFFPPVIHLSGKERSFVWRRDPEKKEFTPFRLYTRQDVSFFSWKRREERRRSFLGGIIFQPVKSNCDRWCPSLSRLSRFPFSFRYLACDPSSVI